MIMPRTSEALFLLQRVRDEAHRFAITHHRSRRSKSMVESLLDDVPGLGEVRRKALLKRFGSLRKMRAASVEEIADVPGIGPPHGGGDRGSLGGGARAAPVAVNTATGEISRRADRGRPRGPSGPTRRRRGAPTTSVRRARRRDRHDRRGPEHRGQGARGPRLLRRRQPAAGPGRGRRPDGRRVARSRAVDRGRRRRPVRARSSSRCAEVVERGVAGRRTTLLYLEADDDVLVRRQEAARRPHPLQAGGRLLDGLAREREVMADIRGDADLVIDTSNLNVHQLTAQIGRRFGTEERLALKVDRGELRLQVRHPGRRRLRRRHALPAQPALGSRAALRTPGARRWWPTT